MDRTRPHRGRQWALVSRRTSNVSRPRPESRIVAGGCGELTEVKTCDDTSCTFGAWVPQPALQCEGIAPRTGELFCPGETITVPCDGRRQRRRVHLRPDVAHVPTDVHRLRLHGLMSEPGAGTRICPQRELHPVVLADRQRVRARRLALRWLRRLRRRLVHADRRGLLHRVVGPRGRAAFLPRRGNLARSVSRRAQLLQLPRHPDRGRLVCARLHLELRHRSPGVGAGAPRRGSDALARKR